MEAPKQASNPSDLEFVAKRSFRAPVARVFAAYTDPQLLPQWWGPQGSTVTVEAMDVRPGGAYRFVQRDSGGQSMVFVGKYLEVHPVTRLVYTFAVEGQGNEIRATVELEESTGGTAITLTTRCASKEARDMMLQYGAVVGAQAVWKRLDELLAHASATPGG